MGILIINYPHFLLSAFFICYSFNHHLSYAADTISANQSLSGEETIVSEGGNFELGFFRPGNSSKSYIGIWYKKVSIQTIVWVANRETPIFDKYSSELKILDGNLVLLNESQIPVWSTDQSSKTSNSVVAVLLDGGNLVLKDGLNSTGPIWESFDNPSHTYLPGSKLGINRCNNKSYSNSLISWKNLEDPAPGLFSLEISDDKSTINRIGSPEHLNNRIWNRLTFSFKGELRNNSLINWSYVHNECETYFVYSLDGPAIISFVLDVTGQFKQLTWQNHKEEWKLLLAQPRKQCDVYSLCGPFSICNDNYLPPCSCLRGFIPKSEKDWNLRSYGGGCERKKDLICGNTSAANKEKDVFVAYPNLKFLDSSQSMVVGSSKECESVCLNNCECTAYAVYENYTCFIWLGDLLDIRQVSKYGINGTLRIRVAASEDSSAKSNDHVKRIAIGVIAGSITIAVFLGLLVIIRELQRRPEGNTLSIRWSPLTERRLAATEGTLVAFRYKDLKNATKSFSQKLGEGGFGSVFKGALPNSSVIAVKKLEGISQGQKQFRAEVSTIGIIQHVNLVRLRGFCCEGNKKLLVYDYMQNGSLNSHLFWGNDSNVLDWKTRYQIALGTARGLAYLHEKCRECIIHCDIKPENILLDAEFCPKLADFGLAKLFGREFSRVLTTMRGTIGYIAPEWISGVAITVKADVYSYGMMLFELISGRRNTEQFVKGRFRFFPGWAASVVMEGGDVLELLDDRLERKVDVEEVRRLCRVACWCVLDDENQRPTMGRVVQTLEGILDLRPPPNIPRFFQAFFDDQRY